MRGWIHGTDRAKLRPQAKHAAMWDQGGHRLGSFQALRSGRDSTAGREDHYAKIDG